MLNGIGKQQILDGLNLGSKVLSGIGVAGLIVYPLAVKHEIVEAPVNVFSEPNTGNLFYDLVQAGVNWLYTITRIVPFVKLVLLQVAICLIAAYKGKGRQVSIAILRLDTAIIGVRTLQVAYRTLKKN